MGTTAASLKFQAETKALLHLMTHSLYTDRELFLRELISNPSDALDRLQGEEQAGSNVIQRHRRRSKVRHALRLGGRVGRQEAETSAPINWAELAKSSADSSWRPCPQAACWGDPPYFPGRLQLPVALHEHRAPAFSEWPVIQPGTQAD